MIGCEIFLTQTLRLTQDDIFLETKFREHKKNTLISSQKIVKESRSLTGLGELKIVNECRSLTGLGELNTH